jgi:sugar/nucleoside kinase (ribokinase family)
MKRILGIGNALVDVMTVIDNDKVLGKFNLPKGSMQLVDDKKSASVKEGTKHCKRSLTSGGSAANTIYGISMLGGKAGFIGSIGKDETGDFFENDLKKAGVKTFLQRGKTSTGTAVALISRDGQRTFATHLGAAVELDAANLNPVDFDGFDILYLEGYLIINKNLTVEACRIAKSRKMKIAIDLASYNVVEANLNAFREVISEYADIVFANEEEAKAFTGKGPKTALKMISQICDIAIVKTGKKGSWIKRGCEVIKVGVPRVKPVDTTGAGDMYAAGFLYGYARNLSLDKCGAIAAISAGKVIEIVGARLSREKWSEIKKSISEVQANI